MTKIDKLSEVLLGGQPRATSGPATAPPGTQFLGRRDPLAAETINRGLFAVSQKTDDLIRKLGLFESKAITKAREKNVTIAFPANEFDLYDGSEDIHMYVGVDPQTSPQTLLDVLQPNSSNTYQQDTENAYTVMYPVGTNLISEVFQVVSLPTITDDIQIQFVPSASFSIVTAGGPPKQITVNYVAGTTTWADAAAAINADATASLWVEAYGDSVLIGSSPDPLNPALNSFVTLRGRGTFDARVEGVFVKSPTNRTALPDWTYLPKEAVASYDSATKTFTLLTDITNNGAVAPGDYVVATVHPTIPSTTPVTGHHRVLKVVSGSASTTGQTFTVQDFDLLTQLGILDSEAVIRLRVYPAELWAIGHDRPFDIPLTYNQPITFEFGEADNVHWFHAFGGIPNLDFSSTDSIIRIASFAHRHAPVGDTGDPSTYTDYSLTSETVSAPVPLVNSTDRLHLLIKPRFGGSVVHPKVSLYDLRLAVTNDVSLDGANIVNVYGWDGSAWVLLGSSIRLEQLYSVSSYKIFRLDPFDTYLPAGQYEYYKLEFNASATETAQVARAYFSGTHGASPVVRVGSTYDITDVELWVVHESGDGFSEIPNLSVDVYTSLSGSKSSFLKIASDKPLRLSHAVNLGPLDNSASPSYLFAYRAVLFDAPFTVEAGNYLLFHVKQGTTAFADQRRVVNVLLAQSQTNSSSTKPTEDIGAFVGTGFCSSGLATPETAVHYSVTAGTSDGWISNNQFKDGSAGLDFTVIASAGDFLHIIDGPNAGTHEIVTVTTDTLTVKTINNSISSDRCLYRILQNSNKLYPSGIEGSSRQVRVVTNVDIEGVGGEVTFGYGEFTTLADVPPDGFRISAAGFGDTGFLSAKISEIMGTPITDPVPTDRNLVNLDIRIKQLEKVTVGIGGGSGVDGKFNASDYGSVDAAISAAIASLGGAGVVVVKVGDYGTGSPSSNIFTGDVVIPNGVILAAEKEKGVVFHLGGNNVVLTGSESGFLGIDVTNASATQSFVWIGGPGTTGAISDIKVDYSTFSGNVALKLGEKDPANDWTLLRDIYNVEISGCDFTTISPSIAIEVDVNQSSTSGTPTAPKVHGLWIRNCSAISHSATTGKGIILATAEDVYLEAVRATPQLLWSRQVVAHKCYFVGASTLATIYDCKDVIVSNTRLYASGDRPIKIGTLNTSVVSSGIKFFGCSYEADNTTVNGMFTIFGQINGIAFIGGSLHLEDPANADHVVFYLAGNTVSLTTLIKNLVIAGLAGVSARLIRNNPSDPGLISVDGLVISDIDTTVPSSRSSQIGSKPIYLLNCNNVSISNVSFEMELPGGGSLTSATGNPAIHLHECSNITIDNFVAKSGDSSIFLFKCDNAVVSNSILTNTDTTNQYFTVWHRYSGQESTRVYLSNNIDALHGASVAVPRRTNTDPLGSKFLAYSSPTLEDGDEILKYGVDDTSTIRMWKHASNSNAYYAYNATEVIIDSDGYPISVAKEDGTKSSVVLLVGKDAFGIYSANASTTSLSEVLVGGHSSANSYNDLAQIGIWLVSAFSSFGVGPSGEKRFRLYHFEDNAVLAATWNLKFLGDLKVDSYDSANWELDNLANPATALVFRSGTTTFHYYTVPANTSGPFALHPNYLKTGWSDTHMFAEDGYYLQWNGNPSSAGDERTRLVLWGGSYPYFTLKVAKGSGGENQLWLTGTLGEVHIGADPGSPGWKLDLFKVHSNTSEFDGNVDVDGTLTATGNVTADGSIIAGNDVVATDIVLGAYVKGTNYVHSPNLIATDGNVTAGGDIYAGTRITTAGYISAGSYIATSGHITASDYVSANKGYFDNLGYGGGTISGPDSINGASSDEQLVSYFQIPETVYVGLALVNGYVRLYGLTTAMGVILRLRLHSSDSVGGDVLDTSIIRITNIRGDTNNYHPFTLMRVQGSGTFSSGKYLLLTATPVDTSTSVQYEIYRSTIYFFKLR